MWPRRSSIAVVLIITLLVATPMSTLASTRIQDIRADHWAYQAVVQMVEKGYIPLAEGNRFLGETPVDRYTLATAIARILLEVESGRLQPTSQETALLRSVTVEFREELVKVFSEVTGLRAELTNLVRAQQVFREDMLGVQLKVEEGERQRQLLSQEVAGLLKVVADEQRKELDQMSQRIQKLDQDFQSVIRSFQQGLDKSLEGLDQDLRQDLTVLALNLTTDLDRIRLELDNRVQQLNRELDEARKSLNSLMDETRRSQGELSNLLEAEKRALATRLEAAEVGQATVQTVLSQDLSRVSQQLTREIDALQAYVTRLETTLAGQEKLIQEEVRILSASMRNDLTETQKALATLTKQYDEMARIVNTLYQEVADRLGLQEQGSFLRERQLEIRVRELEEEYRSYRSVSEEKIQRLEKQRGWAYGAFGIALVALGLAVWPLLQETLVP